MRLSWVDEREITSLKAQVKRFRIKRTVKIISILGFVLFLLGTATGIEKGKQEYIGKYVYYSKIYTNSAGTQYKDFYILEIKEDGSYNLTFKSTSPLVFAKKETGHWRVVSKKEMRKEMEEILKLIPAGPERLQAKMEMEREIARKPEEVLKLEPDPVFSRILLNVDEYFGEFVKKGNKLVCITAGPKVEFIKEESIPALPKFSLLYPREEIEIIEQNLVLGQEAQLHLTYRNIGKRTLRVWLKISWTYDPEKTGSGKWFVLFGERGPIGPQGKETLVYTLLPKFPPQYITNYILQIGTYGWEEDVYEPWKGEAFEFQKLPYAWFNPDNIDQIVKPTKVIETPILPPPGIFSTIEIANLSFAKLSALGRGVYEVIQKDIEKGKLRKMLGIRAQTIALETEILAQYFQEKGLFAHYLSRFDKKLRVLEGFFEKELPDLTFGITPPEDVTVSKLDVGDKVIIGSIVGYANTLLKHRIPFLGKIVTFAVERLKKIAAERFVWKELAYVKVVKPKIGTMIILYDTKIKTSWVMIDLEDLPEKYGFKNEGLDIYILFDSEPPKLKKTGGTYDYKIAVRERSVTK